MEKQKLLYQAEKNYIQLLKITQFVIKTLRIFGIGILIAACMYRYYYHHPMSMSIFIFFEYVVLIVWLYVAEYCTELVKQIVMKGTIESMTLFDTVRSHIIDLIRTTTYVLLPSSIVAKWIDDVTVTGIMISIELVIIATLMAACCILYMIQNMIQVDSKKQKPSNGDQSLTGLFKMIRFVVKALRIFCFGMLIAVCMYHFHYYHPVPISTFVGYVRLIVGCYIFEYFIGLAMKGTMTSIIESTTLRVAVMLHIKSIALRDTVMLYIIDLLRATTYVLLSASVMASTLDKWHDSGNITMTVDSIRIPTCIELVIIATFMVACWVIQKRLGHSLKEKK